MLDQFGELGGAQRMLLDLLPAMRHRGWNVLMGIPREGPLAGRAAAWGCEVAPMDCGIYASGRKSTSDFGRFVRLLPQLAGRIGDVAHRFRPDVIYINGPRLLPAAALAKVRQPVLFHAHIEVSQRLARSLAGHSLKRLNARIIAVCRSVADAWAPFATVSVIYNGVSGPPQSHPCTSGFGPRIGCIGRIGPEKGQWEFLQAAAAIHQAVPNAQFVICGAPLFSDAASMQYERRIREAARGLPVEFTGWVPDVYPVMQRLDLLLMPSVWPEANPRVVLEAFAARVPVIAFRAGGLPEIVEHGRTGFLCGSSGEMAQLAIELLEQRAGCLEQIAETAYERWRTDFQLTRWQDGVLAELESCADLQRAAAASG